MARAYTATHSSEPLVTTHGCVTSVCCKYFVPGRVLECHHNRASTFEPTQRADWQARNGKTPGYPNRSLHRLTMGERQLGFLIRAIGGAMARRESSIAAVGDIRSNASFRHKVI